MDLKALINKFWLPPPPAARRRLKPIYREFVEKCGVDLRCQSVTWVNLGNCTALISQYPLSPGAEFQTRVDHLSVIEASEQIDFLNDQPAGAEPIRSLWAMQLIDELDVTQHRPREAYAGEFGGYQFGIK